MKTLLLRPFGLLALLLLAQGLVACDGDTKVVVASGSPPSQDEGSGLVVVVVSGGSEHPPATTPAPAVSAPRAETIATLQQAAPTPVPALGPGGAMLTVLLLAWLARANIARRRDGAATCSDSSSAR